MADISQTGPVDNTVRVIQLICTDSVLINVANCILDSDGRFLPRRDVNHYLESLQTSTHAPSDSL